ncbi:hypothetical protein BBJ28_00014239 [Nothophytophthora sp. Chile5]|nr:hypothetical protein BBJ28_00014239 [Nothophytophthora sp. Chile5]
MSWLRSKLRQVAARASDALAQAADIVAPTLYASRVDEFHHRWTTVARFLESVLTRELEPAEQRRLLLESHTRDSLQKLVLLIYAEESASDRMELALARSQAAVFDDSAGDGGARTRARSRAQSQTPLSPTQQEHAPRECLEYLLEKQLIPHLCEVGRRDQPCGIMSLAMQFVGALLSRVNYPILPTREVHVSVVALIQAAARKEVEDPVVRKCLIQLLNILWKKLRGDPVQTEFFFLHADRLMVRTTDMAPKPPLTEEEDQPSRRLRAASDDPFLHHHHHHTQSDVPELILFTGLLPHMYAVGKVGEKCREALVIAAAVHDKALCRFVLQLTPFCHYAVNGVISAFDALPKTLAVATNTPTAAAATMEPDGAVDVELGFLAVRLRFCCTLAMVARYELEEVDEVTGELQHRSIADELLDQFRVRFLEGPLLEGLMHTSEAAARAATLYARIILEELTACGRDTRTNPLLCIYLQFLLERPPVSTATPALAKTVTAIAEEPEEVEVAPAEAKGAAEEATSAQLLPTELLHRMDSLSSSLSIATIDLFTSVLDLQDDYADRTLLGGELRHGEGLANDQDRDIGSGSGSGSESSPRRRRLTASSLSSPTTLNNGAIWFASRFPDSAVASNVHLWKIRAFAGLQDVAQEIPAADDQEYQVLSLLSYIADAEYAACQRGPEDLDDFEDDESDDQEESAVSPTAATTVEQDAAATPSAAVASTSSPSGARGSSSRTAATRNAMKPLREVYLSISLPSFSPAEPSGLRQRTQSLSVRGATATGSATTETEAGDDMPLFVRIVLSRMERLLENSFHENLALSGLVYALAQKPRCASVVFDLDEALPAGQSLRSILEEVYTDALRRLNRLPNGATLLQELRKKLVDDDNDAALNDHEAETRLLCGYVVLEEVLKELCSLLFARERVKSLPLKPEGYYLEPKRAGSSFSPSLAMQRSRAVSSETLFSDDGSQADGTAPSPRKQASIGKEFELLLAEAESSMESLLLGSSEAATAAAAGPEVETQIV